MRRYDYLTKSEKLFIKALIEFKLENGFDLSELDPSELENELRRITGNNNCEHRDYVETQIELKILDLKLKEGARK